MPAAPGKLGVLIPEWTLIGVSLALIIARLYLRLKIQRRRLLCSDLLMCLAWILAVASASADVIYARVGALGPHVLSNFQGYDGSPREVARLLKIYWFTTIPFWTALYMCKASLLSVYLQIFPHSMKKRRLFLWATIIYAAIGYVASMLTLFLMCLPIRRNWAIDDTACPLTPALTPHRVAWAFHISTDLMIFTLPWLIVPGLQMRRGLKIGVYCTFLLGAIGIIFSIVRTVTIETSIHHQAIPLSQVELWIALDTNIGLVVACLPPLRQYFRKRKTSNSEQSNLRNTRHSEPGFQIMREPGEFHVAGSRRSVETPFSGSLEERPTYGARVSNESDVELVPVTAWKV